MFDVGAHYLGNGRCSFKVWAPEKKQVSLHLVHPINKILEMQPDEQGYYSIEADGVKEGAEYFFIVEDKKDLPDPASHHQPKGVHGPSSVVDHNAYEWNDNGWGGVPFHELILYELHVGTFSEQGTFEAIIPKLDLSLIHI